MGRSLGAAASLPAERLSSQVSAGTWLPRWSVFAKPVTERFSESENIGMRKRLIGSLTALVLATPAGIALTASSADAATLSYSSCSKLTVKFHDGVAKSRTAAARQVRQGYGVPAYGSLARKVYWQNYRRLDRDRDGTACER